MKIIRASLGDKFLDEVAAGMKHWAQHPKLVPFYYQQFRRLLLHRFPHKIFYQLIGDRVVVFRVLHAKQCHPPKLT